LILEYDLRSDDPKEKDRMAEDNERFRLQMKWLRDEEGNVIAKTSTGDDNSLEDIEDIDGVLYFSDLVVGSPYDAILILAADDVHDSTLLRIELTFSDVQIVLERTDEPATLGDRAQSVAHKEEAEKTPVPVGSGDVVRWH
jgi:hypothetical protein